MSAALSDYLTFKMGLTKTGLGKWILDNGTSSYTGMTTVNR
jgi:autotransporter-associated beta strand protein